LLSTGRLRREEKLALWDIFRTAALEGREMGDGGGIFRLLEIVKRLLYVLFFLIGVDEICVIKFG
jgi:hypothetical protein